MVTKTNKSTGLKEMKRLRRSYYLIIVDERTEGVCTSIKDAKEVAGYIAKQYKATETNAGCVWIYFKDNMKRTIEIKETKRLKIANDKITEE